MILEREMKDREREKGGKRRRGCFSASLPTLKTEKTQRERKNREKGIYRDINQGLQVLCFKQGKKEN